MKTRLLALLALTALTACTPRVTQPAATNPQTVGPTPLLSATGLPITHATTPTFEDQAGDTYRVGDVGNMGLWMLTTDRRRAHWDGQKYQGKFLREPINVILIDRFAKSAQQATERTFKSLGDIGFQNAGSYSSGFQAFLNGEYKTQQGTTFSNATNTNPHQRLRLFGPFPSGDGFIFVGTVATENAARSFVNFLPARMTLTGQLNTKTPFKHKGDIDILGKALTDTETTADHDGCAAIYIARE